MDFPCKWKITPADLIAKFSVLNQNEVRFRTAMSVRRWWSTSGASRLQRGVANEAFIIVNSETVGNKKIVKGKVIEALPDTRFKVLLESHEEILGYLSGKMRRAYIRVVPGDIVSLELSGYDDKRGRIVRRL